MTLPFNGYFDTLASLWIRRANRSVAALYQATTFIYAGMSKAHSLQLFQSIPKNRKNSPLVDRSPCIHSGNKSLSLLLNFDVLRRLCPLKLRLEFLQSCLLFAHDVNFWLTTTTICAC